MACIRSKSLDRPVCPEEYRHITRVKAGMARAKAQGKRISRAPLPAGIQGCIADLYHQGVSMHQMSKQLEIGYGTVWNYVQRVKAGYRL